MHVGLLYPYLFENWQATCFYWPGFVPRKLKVSAPAGYGTTWDLLNAPTVTDVGVPDAYDVGEPSWSYTDPGGLFTYEVFFVRANIDLPLDHEVFVRVDDLVAGVSVVSQGLVVSPQYSFTGWEFFYSSPLPPFSIGIPVPLLIEAATWSEV